MRTDSKMTLASPAKIYYMQSGKDQKTRNVLQCDKGTHKTCSGHVFTRTDARYKGHSDTDTVRNTKRLQRCIHTPKFGFLADTHFLIELGSEVKVTVIRKQYTKLRNPKMYPRNKFGFPTSNLVQQMHRTRFF